MSGIELKPCSWCGKPPKVSAGRLGAVHARVECSAAVVNGKWECRVRPIAEADTLEEAVVIWNTRSQPESVSRLEEALTPRISREVDRRIDDLMGAILPVYEAYVLNDCHKRRGNIEIPVADLRAIVKAVDDLGSDRIARSALNDGGSNG